MGNFSVFSGSIFTLIFLSSFCDFAFGVISDQSLDQYVNEEENQSILELIKDEVQLLNQEFTDSFLLELSRKKRSYSRYTYNVTLDQFSNYLEVPVSSDEAYSFVCNGKSFILQSDGIYRLDGFNTVSHITTENSTTPTLQKVSMWSLSPGDKIMHAFEWKEKCFVLTKNKNGTFSSVYTFSESQPTPIFRQQIRNYGIARAAKFFALKLRLYLIIANDNAGHSLTICPLFRWAGTYMDEIHSIQTRGAVAVETFMINSKQYLVIAQSEDAEGNYEVGTQVLSMDSKEELEKVQLLWSYSPVALKYIQVLQEHILVIGLAKESSICYWFGGIDFIYLQTLDGFNGQTLFMDHLTLPDKEPFLLATDKHSVQFYTRSSSSIKSLNSKASGVLTIKPPTEIVHARFLRPSASQVYLTLVLNNTGFLTLKIFPVVFQKTEIAESLIKESESILSQCLVELQKKLENEGGIVSRLDKEKNRVLTVDGNLKFDGRIITSSNLTLDEKETNIVTADVKPDGNFELEPESTPTRLLYLIKDGGNILEENVISQLPNVLMKSKPGTISGDYTFTNTLEVKSIKGLETNFEFETLNEIEWITLNQYALRIESHSPQIITGKWAGDSLTVQSIQLPSRLADIEINDFLLKQDYPDRDVQQVHGKLVFHNDIRFPQGLIISPDGKVNDVRFSDIVLKNGPTKIIRGYKHVLNLIGDEDVKFEHLNGRDFDEWFESVIHTEGEIQYSEGVKTLSSSKGSKFNNFHAINVNNEPWEVFYLTALVNGTNQTITGHLKAESLTVDSLVALTIGGVRSEDLLTISGDQVIYSHLNISSLSAQKNLNNQLINGLPLSTLVVTKSEDAVINGPCKLENFKINGSITVAELVTIAGKDVSELVKLRQKHIYYTQSKNPINFRAAVVATDLEVEYINKLYWEDLKTKYWSKSSDNVVPGPLDLRGRKVNVKNQFNTETLNSLNTSDIVRTDESNSIQARLNFIGDVVAHGEVYQGDKKTVSGTDISEISKVIVNVNDEKLILGRKIFKANIVASGGLRTSNVNGIDPKDEVVFLESPEEQYIDGLKTFKNSVSIKLLQSDFDIAVPGSVNGFDLRIIEKTTAYQDEPITILGNLQFNNSFYASTLYVEKEINGINFTNLLDNTIFLDQPQTLSFPIAIQNGSVHVKKSSVVNSTNGIVLKDYLTKVVYLTSPDLRINGTKTFTKLASDSNIECHKFNEISLTNLGENAFSKTQSQLTTGEIEFDFPEFEQNLDVKKLGEVFLDDLVYTDEPESCIVNSNVRFTADKTIVNGPLLVTGLLNGYPAEKIGNGIQTALTDREFKEIDVRGDLMWDQNREELNGISDLYENAVSREHSQVITGKVDFLEGFFAQTVLSQPWINGVNLSEINEDGLHIGEEDVVFHGKNIFSKDLKITHLPLGIDFLKAARVDGIDLRQLDRNAVRDTYNGTVYGKKTFADGINAEDLKFNDLLGEGDFHWLVTTRDNRTVDFAKFYDLSVDELNVNRSENFDLEELLRTRFTITGDQVLLGNYKIPGLNATKHCKVLSINGVNVSDIFTEIPGVKQTIDGDKIFSNGLIVNGSMDLPNVNGYNFAALSSDVYKRTEKQVIRRPVVFVQPVLVNHTIEVENHINDYKIDELEARFSNALHGIEELAFLPDPPKIQNLEKLQELKSTLIDRPFWLEYLRLKQNWNNLPAKSRIEHTQVSDMVIIGLHDTTEASGVALPKGCECNNVQFLKINDSTATATFEQDFKCKSAFIITTPLGNVFSVLDHSVSYNQTCSTPETSETVVSRGLIAGSGKADVLFAESSNGFVTDVKSFSENGIDYLVIAHYFNLKTGKHSTGTIVYSVSNGSLNLVQTIPTFGAKRIAITDFQNRWILAIANTKNPQTDSCKTNSAIYWWSSTKRIFELLREVNTNGATDVTFVTAQDRSGNYGGASLSFVAFAQNGNSGDGEVLILMFEEVKKTYLLVESLRTKWSVTGLDYVCIHEACYLLVVIPQEGVHFYEYRYIEGFQRRLTVPVTGAQDIGPFSWANRIYFAIASSPTSILAQGVVAGESLSQK